MPLTATMRETFAPLVDLVYPPRCPLCGEAMATQNGVCASCWSQLVIPGEPCCSRCQRPFSSGLAAHGSVCAPCMAAPPKHAGLYAATLYNDASRKLILAFKHGGRIALADMLGRQVASRLPDLEGEWLVVPVPLHWKRLWRRGFNQAGLLARSIAKSTGQPLLVDGLVRHKPTPVLGGLGRKARARALVGAIAANPVRTRMLKGANIILVDDVITSGATTDACVNVLKRAGARKVVVACFARVLDEALGAAA